MSSKNAQMRGHIVYYGVTILWGILLAIYFFLMSVPLERVIDVKSFTVPDITVGEKVKFYSVRNVKHNIWWEVIEEINMITDEWDQVIFRNKREVFAEKSNKTVSREVEYVHTHTWDYNLSLYLLYDIGILWVQRARLLEDSYTVR